MENLSRSRISIPSFKMEITKGTRASNFRILTSSLRVLPDFLIIGAQKGGTSSMYHYLTQHPSIAPALVKEIHFFDLHYHERIDLYRAYFPTYLKKFSALLKRQKLLTGEATPYYLFHPLCPSRIFNKLPKVKLIALLRNPIDRAYSHYNDMRSGGWETLSFEEAIKSENVLLRGEKEKILQAGNYSKNHHLYSYLSRGIYVEQLQDWMKLFKKEQFLILESESFFTSPDNTMKKVYRFLGISDYIIRNYQTLNARKYDTEMKMETRKWLIEYFRPYNERLDKFLGIEFDWNK